jgi:hypothetical protein
MGEKPFRLACGLYDQIELWSLRKTPLLITYYQQASLHDIEGIITNIMVRQGLELVQINSTLEIETAAIHQVKIKELEWNFTPK